VAWQKTMNLVETFFSLSNTWPREELYGLTQQARRAAISIPSNIAEGQGRRSDGDFARFLSIAHGSLMELETQVEIAHRLQFIDTTELEEFLKHSTEVGRLIHGLYRSLRKPRD
jgi:four helix bundle protein